MRLIATSYPAELAVSQDSLAFVSLAAVQDRYKVAATSAGIVHNPPHPHAEFTRLGMSARRPLNHPYTSRVISPPVIRTAKSHDVDRVMQLIDDGYMMIRPDIREGIKTKTRDLIAHDRVILAFVDDEVAGFGGFSLLRDKPGHSYHDMVKMFSADDLEVRRQRQQVKLERLREIQRETGAPNITFVLYNNYFTQSLGNVTEGDFNFRTTIVDPRFCGREIASRLIQARLEIAKRLGCKIALVTCLGSSGSEIVFAKNGFSPIASFGPNYGDGSHGTEMGRFIT